MVAAIIVAMVATMVAVIAERSDNDNDGDGRAEY